MNKKVVSGQLSVVSKLRSRLPIKVICPQCNGEMEGHPRIRIVRCMDNNCSYFMRMYRVISLSGSGIEWGVVVERAERVASGAAR
jgi:hypothetical protein